MAYNETSIGNEGDLGPYPDMSHFTIAAGDFSPRSPAAAEALTVEVTAWSSSPVSNSRGQRCATEMDIWTRSGPGLSGKLLSQIHQSHPGI
ncbi:glycophorin-C isoform X4 [Brachyhypopomus gauderio]|uniref:glycophorin-C isoform X4 n=1 Tax=Brachyhypopomus gauderio TaxID=698409 RepID=UPI0040420C00